MYDAWVYWQFYRDVGKFLTSANQKHRIWSYDESGLCNSPPRLLGDEVIVGPSLMFRKMDPWNVIRNILQDKTKINCKEKWYSAGKMTFLIKLVFYQKHLFYECMELEFCLQSSTGKSYSNIRITQRPFVNEDLIVANMWWTVQTYN